MSALLTIADLISDPTLDTTVLAGSAGLQRTIHWAQTSESAEPWRWLGSEELLMTLGINLPHNPNDQVDFVRRAHGAGIVAMTVGQDGLAPELSKKMLAEADRLAFPLLSTGSQTPFVVIARTIASVTTNELNRGVLLLSRLYQEAGLQSVKDRRLGQWIEKLCGVKVAVQDTKTGALVIGSHPGEAIRRHSLATLRATQLLVPADAQIDSLVLVHLKQILTVDANALLQVAEDAIAKAETALRLGFEGKVNESEIDAGHWLASSETFRVICAKEQSLGVLAMSLALHGLTPLATVRKHQTLLALREDHLPLLASIAKNTGTMLGLSSAQHRFADLTGAAEEAYAALQTCTETTLLSEFSGIQVSMLTRSASEAEQIVRSVLGGLTAHTDSVRTYRESLFALLDQDLQWQLTATGLGIHRQTLVYRIRQAESLSGRSVRRVADIAELYLARMAWRQLHSKS